MAKQRKRVRTVSSTRKTWGVVVLVAMIETLTVACTAKGEREGEGERLRVTSVSPAEGATGVLLTDPIVITFSDPVSSRAGGTVSISPSVAGLTRSWATDSELTLTFSEPFQSGKLHTVTLDGFATADKETMATWSVSFTTVDDDPTQLSVVSISPASGSSGVSTGAPIVITFSDAVTNPEGGSVSITPEVSGLVLTWTSESQLTIEHDTFTEQTQYSVEIDGFTAAGKVPMDPHTLVFTTTDSGSGTFGPDRPYSTNPTLGKRVPTGAITIDGSNSGEWTDDMLIALDMANDDPRSLGDNWCFHETPFDLTHLWAAWDDDHLYLAWQIVDVTDVIDPANAGSSHGSYPAVMDLIQWIAIDTIPGAGAAIDMWGKNDGLPYWTGADLPDYQLYIASNLWQGFISRAVNGAFVVDDGEIDYHAIDAVGIDVAVGSELAAATLWGVPDADLRHDSAALMDLVVAGHDGSRDSFYEMKIPLAALGNPDVEGAGLGVMIGQGEMSPVDTIPNDPATLDTPGTSQSNSPLEWGDVDSLTVSFARVGHF